MKVRGNKFLKILDRYIGIPCVFFIGFLRNKKKLKPIKAESHFVLLKTNAIGDAILLSAVIQELRQNYPLCSISVVCGKSNVGIVKLLDGVDDIFCFSMRHPFKSLVAARKFGDFDILLDFGPWMRINALISACMHAEFKVGFKRPQMYRHYVYDAAISHCDNLHEVDNYRSLLRGIGVDIKGFLPRFKVLLNDICDEYVVFHPFPGGAMQLQRKWPLERWVELGKYVGQTLKKKILISGGKEDVVEAKKIGAVLRESGVDVVVLAGKTNLQDMLRILAGAQLLVSVNTGIMHLGAAVGTKIVALHGATDPKRWGPLTDKAIVIQSGDVCQPCISLGFESMCTDAICMKNITPEKVQVAVRAILES